MADNISSLRTSQDEPSLFDKLRTTPQLSRQDQYALTNPDESQFTKGLRSGAVGLTAGSFANEALSGEVAGNPDWQSQRDLALRTQNEGGMFAPRVSSLRDVHGVGDLVDYASGSVGQGVMSMAPTIAAAAVARGRGSEVPAFLGALVPSYNMERGEEALNQYSDPVLSQVDAKRRDAAATAKGGINAALESIVPAGLANGMLTKPTTGLLKTIGKDMVEEGLTEGLQQGVSFASEKALDPNRQLDPWDVIDATAGGALTGGSVGGAHHAANHILTGLTDKIGEMPEAKPPGDKPFVDEALDNFQEAAKDAPTPEAFLHKAFNDGTEADAEPLINGDADPSLAGDTPEETEAALRQRDTENLARAAKFADALVSDPKTPEAIKKQVADLGGDYSSPEAQSFLARTVVGQRAEQRIVSAADQLVELSKKIPSFVDAAKDQMPGVLESLKGMVEGAKTGLPKAIDATKDFAAGATQALAERVVKKNLQEVTPAEKAAFTKMAFDGLTDEAKSSPEIRSKLPELATAMLAFAARSGDLTTKDMASIAKVKDALSIFKDPSATAQKLAEYAGLPRMADSFLSKIKDIQTAQADATKPDSFLYRSLTEKAKDTLRPSGLNKLAQMIDNFSVSDYNKEQGDKVLHGLAAAFGTVENAKLVLDFYQQQNRADLQLDSAPAEHGLTEHDSEPGATYHFAEPKAQRPFRAFAGSPTDTGGMRLRLRESTRAAAALKRMGVTGEGDSTRAIPYTQYAKETGKDPNAEVKRLMGDLKDRLAQHEARKGEDRSEQIAQLKGELSMAREMYKQGGPEAVLNNYEVLRTEHGKQTQEGHASDEELSKFATLADAKDARGTRVTFEKTDGSKITLSAESMWKTLGDKEGSGKGEYAPARARRLFNDAAASVLARPDIAKMLTKPEQITIDRNMEIRAQHHYDPEYLHLVGDGLHQSQQSLKNLRASLKEIEDWTPAQREKALEKIDRDEASALQLLGRARDDKNVPAQAVAKERLRLYRDARSNIEQVRLEEERAQKEAEKAGTPGMDETGPIGPNELPRTRMNEELGDKQTGPRMYEEDTGLGIGVEKRGSNPTAQSSMDPSQGPGVFTKAQRQAIIDEVGRIRGPDVKLAFQKFLKIGGSGEFSMNADKTNRLIKIAIDALNPMSVAWHESLHDFMATLGGSKEERQLKKDLLDAASTPHVMTQLRELLKAHPNAIKQIESDKEERLAYLYQFWAEGAIKMGNTGNTVFHRIAQFIREMLGVLSKDQKINELLGALHEGKLAEPSLVTSVLKDLKAHTLGDKVREISGPIGKLSDAVFSAATDRLRDTNVPALAEIADMFHRDPGNEKGEGLPFLQARSQLVDKNLNKLQALLEKTTNTERRAALENFQAMKPPSTPLEKGIANLLEELHTYMVDSGVKRFDPKLKEWVDLNKVGNYFPRNWDKNTLRNREADFIQLLVPYIGLKQARESFEALVNGDGTLELNENENHLGFTPWAKAVLDRQFTFIDPSNAAQFAPFQSKDITDTLTTYIQQAVHRGEYAKTFGNAGEVIKEKLAEAVKQGAESDEIAMAQKAVMAMEGTLGHDFNPRLKQLMSGIMTYQNIVLLPLALFSSLIDPLGVAMRSNDMKEAVKAFTYGMKGIAEALTKKGPDEQTEMAKLLGLISDQNMLESMGHVYNSMYMSKYMKTINNKFFRYNGMELWNQRMRTAAMMAAQRFIVKNLTNKRYMDELGITSKDVFQQPDGTIALTADQLKTAGAPAADIDAIEKRIQAAVYKFVDGGVLRPNAAHRPIWGSDPRFALIFHLKQFTYSFQNVILKRVGEELKHGNTTPAWILASYVPFMLAADIVRGAMTGTLKTNVDLYDMLSQAVARSGIMGLGAFGDDVVGDAARGNIPGTSFLGPTFDHLMTLISTISGHSSVKQAVERSVPGGAALRGVL